MSVTNDPTNDDQLSEKTINEYPSYPKIDKTSKRLKPFKHEKIWYVTEKIHGSNFSFHYDVINDTFQFGKRNSFIKEKDDFFRYRLILPDILPKIRMLNTYVLEKYPDCSKIIVYGELFGGSYPHKSIPINRNVQAVQKGVFYSPDIHFYGFDIRIVENNELHYIDFGLSLQLFQQAGILFAEPLATFSTYEEAVEYPIGFSTFLPIKFGLPPLENNKAEGIVIRSSTGRFLVKIKIPEFSETKFTNNDYHKDKKGLNDLEMKKLEASNELTSQRLDNAISKIGTFEDHKEEIFEELVNDILSEINGYHVNGLYDWLHQQASEIFQG